MLFLELIIVPFQSMTPVGNAVDVPRLRQFKSDVKPMESS